MDKQWISMDKHMMMEIDTFDKKQWFKRHITVFLICFFIIYQSMDHVHAFSSICQNVHPHALWIHSHGLKNQQI